MQPKALIEVSEKSSVFSSKILDLEPYDFQKVFLDDNSKRICFKSGRQVGKTLCTAIKALHFAIFNPNVVVLCISYSERQAGILFGRVKQLLDKVRKSEFKVPIKRETARMVEIGNASEIHTVPAGDDGSGARGYTADIVILDEASRMNELIFEAVQPCLAATDGTLILLSTPFGKRGFFYESFVDDAFSVYDVPSNANPPITEDFLLDMQKRMTKTSFRQEYLGEFISEADRLFSDELIDSCTAEYEYLKTPDWESGAVYRMGCDPARLGEDDTAYTIIDASKKPYRVVWMDSESGRRTDYTANRIKALHTKWKFSTCIIDETALGGGVVDQIMDVPHRGLNFTGIKGDLFQNLVLLMEQGNLIIPRNDKLILQLAGMSFEYLANGKMKVSGDSRLHDDLPTALALACYNLNRPTPVIKFLSR